MLGRFAIAVALLGALSACAGAQGFSPLAMPNKQATHLPGVTLKDSPGIVFDELPTHSWQMQPWSHAATANFSRLPDSHLLPPSTEPLPNLGFHHSALSARPVGTRTTIAATQIELATQFPRLPQAEPMVPALQPERNLSQRKEPASGMLRSEPLTRLPEQSTLPPTLTLPARRASASSLSSPAPHAAAHPTPRAPAIDYGALLWQHP
jgi:hypothetical protein